MGAGNKAYESNAKSRRGFSFYHYVNLGLKQPGVGESGTCCLGLSRKPETDHGVSCGKTIRPRLLSKGLGDEA